MDVQRLSGGCLLDPLEVTSEWVPQVDMASQRIDFSALDQNLHGV